MNERDTFTPADIERFWSKVDKDNADGCWLWKGNTYKFGYGSFHHTIAPRTHTNRLAHRVSWLLASDNQNLDSSVCVLHRCDNPRCVNPDHLFLGSIADNNADRDAKGRTRKARGSQV